MKFSPYRSLVILLSFLFVFSSCQTTRDVANGRVIQKRKFNKGFHVNLGKKAKKIEKEVKATEIDEEYTAETTYESKAAEILTVIPNEEVKKAQKSTEATKPSKKQKKSTEKKASKKEDKEPNANGMQLKKKYSYKNKGVEALNFDPADSFDQESDFTVRQGLYVILIGLLVGLAGEIIGIGFISWAGGVIVFVGLIILILSLLEGF